MFAFPVYVAILTGRRHADVLALFETKEAAIDQCRAWIRHVPDVQPHLVPVGFEWFAQYGIEAETVRVEKHHLELQEEEQQHQSIYLPGPKLLTLDLEPEGIREEGN